MKNFKGNLLIIFTVLITLVLWFTATPMIEIGTIDKIRHVIGGLALNSLFLVFLLSTRNKKIENYFNGLNQMYIYHKYLAISAVAAIMLHAALAEIATAVEVETFNLSVVFAQLATFLFIVLALISLFGKKVKYEDWRLSHRLMFVAYLAGLVHTSLSSKYDLFQFNALSIWTWLTGTIGILAGIYIIFIYQNKKFKYKGKVTNLHKLSSDVLEVEITLDQQLNYQKGQFVFIKVVQQGIDPAPHPFSIAGGDGKKIIITIKSLGDFTKQVYELLKMNSKILVEGPYGHMNFNKGRAKQLWIAGGIGITPFISFLKGDQLSQSIDMFYSYKGKDNAIYKDFLEEFQKTHQNFHVHFVDSLVDGRLNFDNYPIQQDMSVFMCGPAAMMDSFAKIFKEKNKKLDIVYEGFNLK